MTQPPPGDQPPGEPTAAIPPYGGGPPYQQAPGYGPPYGAHPGYGSPYGPPVPGYGPAFAPGYAYAPQYAYVAQPAGPPQDKPSNNIGWAIAAIFLFWPLAIPAFIFSGKVDPAWNVGDRAGAESASRSAKQFGLIAVIVGVVLAVLIVIWVIVILAFVADTVRHIPTITFSPVPTR